MQWDPNEKKFKLGTAPVAFNLGLNPAAPSSSSTRNPTTNNNFPGFQSLASNSITPKIPNAFFFRPAHQGYAPATPSRQYKGPSYGGRFETPNNGTFTDSEGSNLSSLRGGIDALGLNNDNVTINDNNNSSSPPRPVAVSGSDGNKAQGEQAIEGEDVVDSANAGEDNVQTETRIYTMCQIR
jgi:hypothetical protein